eukprot:360622-Chlamydomonas_euryale.AAC.14
MDDIRRSGWHELVAPAWLAQIARSKFKLRRQIDLACHAVKRTDPFIVHVLSARACAKAAKQGGGCAFRKTGASPQIGPKSAVQKCFVSEDREADITSP